MNNMTNTLIKYTSTAIVTVVFILFLLVLGVLKLIKALVINSTPDTTQTKISETVGTLTSVLSTISDGISEVYDEMTVDLKLKRRLTHSLKVCSETVDSICTLINHLQDIYAK